MHSPKLSVLLGYTELSYTAVLGEIIRYIMKKLTITAFAFALLLFMPSGNADAHYTTYYQPTQPITYTYSGDQDQLMAYLRQLILQLQTRIDHGGYHGTRYRYSSDRYGDREVRVVGRARSGSSDDDEPEADTNSAKDIDGDEAELRGEVDMNDFNNGEVFFVYGQDEDQIEDVEDDYDSYGDVDEDGDDLQKVRVDHDLDGDEEYEETVDNLEEDEDYFFQICVGYEDDDDDDVLECGGVEEFTADDDNGSGGDDEPEAFTDEAEDVEDDEAELHGRIYMNDFDDGRVFFVYGEDEGQVEDIEDDYDEYDDIDEDGEDLQKVLVDSSLDGSRSYWERVTNLDDNTDHYFQICVEYEDDDNDPVITCGGVEDFETD